MDSLASLVRPASRTAYTSPPSVLYLRPSTSSSTKHALRQPIGLSQAGLGHLPPSSHRESQYRFIAQRASSGAYRRRIPRPSGPRNPRPPCQLGHAHSMSPKPITVLSDATNTVRKGLRRMASGGVNNNGGGTGTGSDRPRARGKENYPPCPQLFSPTFTPAAPIAPNGAPSTFVLRAPPPSGAIEGDEREARRRVLELHGISIAGSEMVMVDSEERYRNWAAVDGKIVIKVAVPSTDDIWRFRVPQDVSLRTFRRKVEVKVGFSVSFFDGSGEVGKKVGTEEGFRRWVDGRIAKDGRNTPLVAVPRAPKVRAQPSQPRATESGQVESPGGPFLLNAALSTPTLEAGLLSPTMYSTPGLLLSSESPFTPFTPVTPAMPITPGTPSAADFLSPHDDKQRTRCMF